MGFMWKSCVVEERFCSLCSGIAVYEVLLAMFRDDGDLVRRYSVERDKIGSINVVPLARHSFS